MSLDIDIVISTCEDMNDLGRVHNRYLRQSSGWVCIIDSDEMFLHPKFHIMLRNAIRKQPDAGLFVCGTNRTGGSGQRWTSNDTDDIKWHTEFSIDREKKFSGVLTDVTDLGNARSGNIMLTHRDVWESVGGFDEGRFLGVDTRYFGKVKSAGYRIYLMEDMYIYHRYSRYWKNENSVIDML